MQTTKVSNENRCRLLPIIALNKLLATKHFPFSKSMQGIDFICKFEKRFETIVLVGQRERGQQWLKQRKVWIQSRTIAKKQRNRETSIDACGWFDENMNLYNFEVFGLYILLYTLLHIFLYFSDIIFWGVRLLYRGGEQHFEWWSSGRHDGDLLNLIFDQFFTFVFSYIWQKIYFFLFLTRYIFLHLTRYMFSHIWPDAFATNIC